MAPSCTCCPHAHALLYAGQQCRFAAEPCLLCSPIAHAVQVDGIKAQLPNPEQQVGADIVRRALGYPLKLIANNAGTNGSVVMQKVLDAADQNIGYNAATGVCCLMCCCVVPAVRHPVAGCGKLGSSGGATALPWSCLDLQRSNGREWFAAVLRLGSMVASSAGKQILLHAAQLAAVHPWLADCRTNQHAAAATRGHCQPYKGCVSDCPALACRCV